MQLHNRSNPVPRGAKAACGAFRGGCLLRLSSCRNGARKGARWLGQSLEGMVRFFGRIGSPMSNGTDTECRGEIRTSRGHWSLTSVIGRAYSPWESLRTINLARWTRLVWLCTVGAFAWSGGIGWSADLFSAFVVPLSGTK